MESLELTTISILSLFETTKEERASFVADLISRIENGAVDPLKVHLQIKGMEDIINQLTSTNEKTNKNVGAAIAYRKYLLDAAAQYSAKSFEAFNGKFEIKETGTKYDYSKCEDPVLEELLKEQAAIDERVKARQKLLQSAPAAGLILTNEDTGETSRVYPPSKSSTTSVAVTLK